MTTVTNLENVPALLLVGGMGTRLRSVISSVPKPMAPLGSESFLELLVRQLYSQGIRKVVMCVGYLGEQIESKFQDGSYWGMQIRYSREESPLGTAGAVKLAGRLLVDSTDFLVMNGDSFLESDLYDLFSFHRERNCIATLAVREVADAARYGTVQVGPGGRVMSFVEKTGYPRPGLVNGGIYLFRNTVFTLIPEGRVSLETEVFPRLLNDGIYAREQRGMFIDIGTPSDYALAKEMRERLFRAAR